MAVPKQHDSKGKVGRRRSQKKMKRQDVLACPFCKAPTLPHRACPNCGKKWVSSAKSNSSNK